MQQVIKRNEKADFEMKKQISIRITESTNIILRIMYTTHKPKDSSQTSVQSDSILKCYCCQRFM